MQPEIIVAVLAAIPASVLAAASWRSARRAGSSGDMDDLKKLVWITNEEVNKIKWFLVEHVEAHQGITASRRNRRSVDLGRIPDRRRA